MDIGNMINKGTITLSFDCEGKWGMIDSNSDWVNNISNESLVEVYKYILDVLNFYDIPATFAFVGALTEKKETFMELNQSHLTGYSHKKWINLAIKKINENEDGWFAPKLLELVKNEKKHEIASHSYSHTPFNKLNIDEALIELSLVKKWSEKNKINCQSFIFPRNLIAYDELLLQFGINFYRDTPNNFNYKFFPRLLNMLIEELLIFKKGEDLKNNNKIPGGTFINWMYGSRRIIPSQITLLKNKSIINSVKYNNNKNSHFWLHPHNLISAPRTRINFENLCKSIHTAKKNDYIVVKKMNEYSIN